MRRAAKVDANQAAIVAELRQIDGITVQPGHDDILVGYKGRTYWFEVKSPEVVSAKTGEIRPSGIKASQQQLLAEWTGHYQVVWELEQIMEALGIGQPSSGPNPDCLIYARTDCAIVDEWTALNCDSCREFYQ